jgi:hypothetical protein
VRSLVMSVFRGRAAMIAIALLMSATVAGAAGCAAVRSGLGTSSSVCFRAIPVGRGAITPPTTTGSSSTSTSSGKPVPTTFVGVRSATQKDIDTFGSAHDYLSVQLTERNGGPLKGLCLVAFRGSFDPASVQDLLGVVPPPGHRIYAVAVVSEPSNKLLATFLRGKEPISFTHYVVGGG